MPQKFSLFNLFAVFILLSTHKKVETRENTNLQRYDVKSSFWSQDPYILFVGDSTKLKICYTLLEMSYIVYIGWISMAILIIQVAKFESGQLWKLTKLKVDKIEYCQNWILQKLKFAKTENFQSWQNWKLLSC